MSAAKSWFVQTGFGTLLGPMPEDALRELVRTGALVRTDQVREGESGDWQSAGEIPGFFDSESPSQSMPTAERSPMVSENDDATPAMPASMSSLTGLIAPAPSLCLQLEAEQTMEPSAPPTIANAAVSLDPKVSAIEPPVVAATTAVPVFDEAAAVPPLSPASELINAWKMNRSRSTDDLGMKSLADEMRQAEVAEVLAPELPSELFDDELTATIDVDEPIRRTSRSSVERPVILDEVAGLEAGPRQTGEMTRQKWERWRRSLPSRPIAVVLVVASFAILATWWLWPRSQRAIYNRYVALWSEWKQRRGDLRDEVNWEHFLRHADAELNDIVPWLEKNTRATDNEKRLLLFIGRDCLMKIRMQPRQQGLTQEKQLEELLAQVRERYEPSMPVVPRDAFIGAKSVPVKKSAPQPPTLNRPSAIVPVFPDPSEPTLAVPKTSEVSTPP